MNFIWLNPDQFNTLGLRLPQKNVTAHSYGSFDLAARSRIMISTIS